MAGAGAGWHQKTCQRTQDLECNRKGGVVLKEVKIGKQLALFDFERMTVRIGAKLYSLSRPATRRAPRIYLKFNSNCNLSCGYCFQKQERPLEPIRNINHYTLLINKLADMKASEIIVFGGEPFLRENLYNIDSVIRRVTNKLTFFTNGYHDDLVAEFIMERKDQFNKIIITIDGPEAVHNRRRSCDTKNTYALIIENLLKYLECGIGCEVHVNIDKDNIMHMETLLLELEDLLRSHGIKDKLPIVVSRVQHVENTVTPAELMLAFIDIALNRNFYHLSPSINSVVLNKLSSLLLNTGYHMERCGVGEMMVFDFNTETIYTCPQSNKTRIGNFNLFQYSVEEGKKAQYRNYAEKKLDTCLLCSHRGICGYGCYIDKDIDGMLCKRRTEEELDLILENFNLFFRLPGYLSA